MAIPSPKPTHARPVSTADGATPAARAIAPGDLIAERYRVVKLLGEGGMGAVYLTEHIHMRKTVALKVLHADVQSHPELVARFEREAVAAAHVNHPNVTAATDFGRLPDGSFFLVLEYVDGRSLRAELEHGPLAPPRAVSIARGVAAGLTAAHAQGIVHRDLKPENIMLVDRDGDPDFVKVLDFGIAKIDPFKPAGRDSGTQPLTRIGSVFGTPDYMSPEQALGQDVDLRTDLYAVGIILFEMLTGECPFRGGAVTVLRERVLAETAPAMPGEVAARVDPRIQGLVGKLLMRSADARFQTAAELEASLDDVARTLAPAPARAYTTEQHAAAMAPTERPLAPAISISLTRGARRLLASKRNVILLALAVGGALALVLFTAAVSMALSPAHPTRIEHVAAIAEVAARVASKPATSAAAAPSGSLPAPSDAPTFELPPPPPQASAAARPTQAAPRPSQGQSTRKTGPGGIYIPPPSEWFK